MKRLVGKIIVAFSDGSVEECVIKERSLKNYVDRLKEAMELILESNPGGKVKIRYRGPLTAAIHNALKMQSNAQVEACAPQPAAHAQPNQNGECEP